ncbi:MAG TPA: prolyl oligopeptidase family serine peptidase, partial [Symbiobacteriaceae bacterium]|nr:prolyl oligopeptidase family serine peptidase [Symbiobacteriaceae bacterium]
CQVLHGGGVFETQLTGHNRELLDQIDLPVPERFAFCASEGAPQVDGWVLRPAGFEPGTRYPAVLEIHGGPMGMYGCGFFYEFQWLAAQGYAVVYANPRGSQGYGQFRPLHYGRLGQCGLCRRHGRHRHGGAAL